MDIVDTTMAYAKALNRHPFPGRQPHLVSSALRKAHKVWLYSNRKAQQQASCQTKTKKPCSKAPTMHAANDDSTHMRTLHVRHCFTEHSR